MVICDKFVDVTISNPNPAEKDVSKTYSGLCTQAMTPYDKTRRRDDVWKKTSDLLRLKEVYKTTTVWQRLRDFYMALINFCFYLALPEIFRKF